MAVALLPLNAPSPRPCTAQGCALDALTLAALETALHGRPRDPSRGGEGWLGPTRSARTARLAGAPPGDLAVTIAMRLVEAGLVASVVSSADALHDAVARGSRRLALLAAPCVVHATRLGEPIPGLNALYVIGTGAPAGMPDAVNALADVSILMPEAPAAWAVVRNARGRAILDQLGADLSLDAIGPSAFAAAAAAFGPGRAS